MKKRAFLKGSLAAAAAVTASPALAQQRSGPSYNWKMATAWPGGPLMDIGAKAFAERLAFFSGGRM
jgi:TRAP-type mannitol/chloroaromatic compound transport system substrate-binding protein